MRSWAELRERHLAFWSCAPVDRPLIVVTHQAYQDTETVAQSVGAEELTPDRIAPEPLLAVYDSMQAEHAAIGDDMVLSAEPLLGIPWLEAACGCRVLVPNGKSLWPEPSPQTVKARSIAISDDNPWLLKLLETQRTVIAHAAGRYPVSMSHLRGPTDVLAAMLGSTTFLTALYDEPEHIIELARDAVTAWRRLAVAQAPLIPAFRGGYVVRQFGLWSPEPSVWLQDDTSSMLSLRHYRGFFLDQMRRMAATFPYGVLHLHAPSLHLGESFAEIEGIRAINIYFDSPAVSLAQAMPTLQRLQQRAMPLVLAKDVYAGFTFSEYEEIVEGLSPRGLSVHLAAESVEEGREVMEAVIRRAG